MFSQIIVLIVLILLNAFFASTEIAFISLNDNRIAKKANEGDKKAKSINKMLQNPSKFLATIQIGITLAGFLSSAFASEAFASRLAVVLDQAFPLGISFWTNVSIIVITIILSYFSLVFGELVPKRIAMKYSEKVAYFSIGVIKFISIIAAPFVKFLTISTNLISKLFGIKENEEEIVTEEDIKDMVDAGKEDGTIEEDEKELINNVFEFNDKVTSEIMRHRTEMFALDINDPIDELIDGVTKNGFSRVPIYEENIDNIKGLIYVKDLIKYMNKDKKIKISELMKEPYFVSETKPINELFRELQMNKKQAAIVVDEYGGTAGFVTMEDILEELVGNIFDEYDKLEKDYEKIDDNTYIVSGSLPIYEFEKLLEVEIPEGDYDTISGYIIDELGRIPQNNEKVVVETELITYKIEECKNQRILKVKVCKNNPKKETQKEEEE